MKKRKALFDRNGFNARMKRNSELFSGVNKTADAEAVNLSIYSLAAEGFELDDILDPEKLPVAKSRAYAKVTKALGDGGDSANRQIAEIIFGGRRALGRALGKKVSRVDLSSPDAVNSRELADMVGVGRIITKTQRTQQRFGRESADVAARETNGRIATFGDYYASTSVTPLDMFADSSDRIPTNCTRQGEPTSPCRYFYSS